MPRGIDQIKDILFSVFCLINNAHRLRFDRNSTFSLQIHIIKYLRLHFTAGQCSGHLNDAVRQRGLSMVNMCNDAKVSDFTLIDM